MLSKIYKQGVKKLNYISKYSFSAKARLLNKTAFITGGGNGIGRETCRLFAEQGSQVMVIDKNEQGCKQTVDIILNNPETIITENDIDYCVVDVSKSHQIEQAMAKTYERFGRLNVIFNNAGIMHPDDGTEADTSDEIWDLTFNINVKGVFYGCKYGIPFLKKSGGGSIINTCSFVAFVGAATSQLAYTSSKGAVLSMTRELATIHAKDNIRVNNLCPGPIRTPLLMDFLDTNEKKNRRLVHVPMGRFGEAVEMAQGVVFLASDESSYMTNQELIIDGGLCNAYVTPEDLKNENLK